MKRPKRSVWLLISGCVYWGLSTPTDASHVFGNSFCLITAEDFVMVLLKNDTHATSLPSLGGEKLKIKKAALYHWLFYIMRLWDDRTERTCLFHEVLFACPVKFQGLMVISFSRYSKLFCVLWVHAWFVCLCLLTQKQALPLYRGGLQYLCMFSSG